MAGSDGKPIAPVWTARAAALFGGVAAMLRNLLVGRNRSGLPTLDLDELPEHLSRDLGFRDGRTVYRENEPWLR